MGLYLESHVLTGDLQFESVLAAHPVLPVSTDGVRALELREKTGVE